MIEEGFTKLCKVSDLSDRQGKRFIVDDTEVALFKVDDQIYALSNICPHQHTALIYDGFIEDECVVCPAHGWKFELSSGKLNTGRNGLASYPVLIKEGDIFIKVTMKEMNW